MDAEMRSNIDLEAGAAIMGGRGGCVPPIIYQEWTQADSSPPIFSKVSFQFN